ncbi:phosphatidate cytidylyltransferase [Pseudodonghicola flavimaris]|uniref:Phosphatidate cytidylyltransferase n=1 Tax=Pseudodonghicola flavimaris TaxID=3050036 RepID=A0ABT7F7N9_9RHOB|nr:phosphatidate cytidylyltransferase [Pseudodonghicola flavimaris]MDK3020384.1 phosphatidate cytidylyltransferase [Pseudodonghicola flavimaris]
MSGQGGAAGRWGDLTARVLSGIVLAAAGLGAVWAGGYIFITFVSIATGLIVWELTRMMPPDVRPRSVAMGLLAGGAAFLAIYLKAGFALPILLVPAIIGFFWLPEHRRVFVPFLIFILMASFGMMSVRNEFGFPWMAWLVLVVAGTDIAGYFAGRIFGGPKFWPRISPKKTWSGTAAGWVVAMAVGWLFMPITGAGAWLIWLSALAAFASQLGDIAESAVKRRAGVKDSSALIPGHGGLFDRFDGMLGAAILVLVIMQLTGYPPGPV